MTTVQVDLKQFVRQKELEWKRDITWLEISQQTGIALSTLNRFATGKAQRVDLGVLYKLCGFFEVPDGAPVPFLVYEQKSHQTKPQGMESRAIANGWSTELLNVFGSWAGEDIEEPEEIPFRDEDDIVIWPE